MPHRALDSTGWDDLLLDTLLSSPLPPCLPKNMVTRVRELAMFVEGLSAKFISLHMRRSITNVYQHAEGVKELDRVS